MASKATTALLAGGLGVVVIGAIALSSRKAHAASKGATAPALAGNGIAPTTGEFERVEEGVNGILAELPEANLDMFVLGSLDNAAGLVEAQGADGLLAVYTPDDIGAIYEATHALGTASSADLASAEGVLTTLDATSTEPIQLTGRSIWLDEAAVFDALENGHRMDPVIDKFLLAQSVVA